MKILLILSIFYTNDVAVDHIPFQGITMEQCNRIGERFKQEMEKELIWSRTASVRYVCVVS